MKKILSVMIHSGFSAYFFIVAAVLISAMTNSPLLYKSISLIYSSTVCTLLIPTPSTAVGTPWLLKKFASLPPPVRLCEGLYQYYGLLRLPTSRQVHLQKHIRSISSYHFNFSPGLIGYCYFFKGFFHMSALNLQLYLYYGCELRIALQPDLAQYS